YAHPPLDAGSSEHCRVQLLAHPVQTLELERTAGADLENPSDRMRVVRRELRQQMRVLRQQVASAREVRHVGARLAREYRIAVQAELLRALDLGVPVRALDE